MMELLIIMLNTISLLLLQTSRSTISNIGILLLLIQLEINLILNFMAFIESSFLFDDIIGQIFGLHILVLGACETALGLSLLVSYYKLSSHLSLAL